MLAALVTLAARPSATRAAGDGPLAGALRSYGVDSLDELERRAAEEDRAVAAASGRREERERQSEDRAQARSRIDQHLRETLAAAGASSDGPVDDAVGAYLTGCDRHAERERFAARLDALDAELLRAREPQRDLETRRQELTQREAALLAAYAQAGASAPGLKEAETTYEALAARAQGDEDLLAEGRQAEEALRVALAGQTPQQLNTALADATTRLREHIAQHGELTTGPGNRSDLDRRLAELHQQIEADGNRAAALAARIDEREAAASVLTTLEERIAHRRDRQRRFQQAADAIRLAREGLAEAARQAHRAFAPHLNAALQRDLPRVTGGRYTRATVGDDLEIKVIAPETDALVAITTLSRGTQDQIALVERLAIARMLDPTTGHAPLLLDDPFAHTDPARRRQALELIGELARERQIILGTEDPALPELAEEACGEIDRVDLPAPAVQGAPSRRNSPPAAPIAED